MKKKYLIILTLIVCCIGESQAQLSCPIDSCGNFSNYFINTGPALTTNQQAVDSGFFYTIKQNQIVGADTTVCYAFVQPASGDWSRLQIFVSYPSCPGNQTNYTGYGTGLSSYSNGNWNSNISNNSSGNVFCIKGTLTGNPDPGTPNEFTTLGTFQYPNCNKVASTLNTGNNNCSLIIGQTYKHCFKILKSTTCPGDIIISPIITCTNGCVPPGKTCKPIEYLSTVTNSTCIGNNLNGAIDLSVCAHKKLSYLWSDNGSTLQDRTGLSAGTYQVTITDTESKSCDTVVNFVISPEICKGVKITNRIICKGSCDTITPIIIGLTAPYTIKWSDGYSTLGIHTVCPTTTTTYTVTLTAGTTTYTSTATVSVLKTTVIASKDTTLCPNDSAKLNATGAISYVWSPSTYLSNTTIANPIAKPTSSGVYNYVVTGIGTFGCIGKDTVKVTMLNLIPTADIGLDKYICPKLGDTALTITATGGNRFIWSTGEITQSIVVHPTETTVYSVIVGNTCGTATATDEMTVTVRCGVDIPNVFTPNGDMDNQYFYIKNLEGYPGSRLEIYDRWGLKMYISDNYDNDWDGRNYYQNKQEVSDGVYYYILYLSDKDKTVYKGFVQVIRSK